MINLEQKIKAMSNNMATPTDVIPYIMMPKYSSSLINASVPLTRRERRALKRKEKKYGTK